MNVSSSQNRHLSVLPYLHSKFQSILKHMSAFRVSFRSFTAAKRASFACRPSNTFFRCYASSIPKEDIESRVLTIVKAFDKVDQSKISASSTFANDLGLDSLDTVEVVMAIEEEFSLEIPDKEADDIKSVADAIKYISEQETGMMMTNSGSTSSR